MKTIVPMKLGSYYASDTPPLTSFAYIITYWLEPVHKKDTLAASILLHIGGASVRVLLRPPSVPTLGTASELIRYDRLAFLYANPGPMPPFSPVFRRITRLGLQHGPGSFVNFAI